MDALQVFFTLPFFLKGGRQMSRLVFVMLLLVFKAVPFAYKLTMYFRANAHLLELLPLPIAHTTK